MWSVWAPKGFPQTAMLVLPRHRRAHRPARPIAGFQWLMLPGLLRGLPERHLPVVLAKRTGFAEGVRWRRPGMRQVQQTGRQKARVVFSSPSVLNGFSDVC